MVWYTLVRTVAFVNNAVRPWKNGLHPIARSVVRRSGCVVGAERGRNNMVRETITCPADLGFSDDDRVCPKCGCSEFYERGITEDGEAIYECSECGELSYGMD